MKTTRPRPIRRKGPFMTLIRQATPLSPAYQYQVRPIDVRIRAALEKVCLQLPMRVASRISVIRFGPEGVIDPHYEVEFKGGKVLEFEDIETFPTRANVARIVRECP